MIKKTPGEIWAEYARLQAYDDNLELPDTVKQKVTEAEAYSTVWDIQMKLQHALPRSVVYYGQDTLKDGGTRYDELGVFLPLEHFADRLERHVETATKIVYGE